jgi:hypothetical protein
VLTATELAINRANTAKYISLDPTTITLTPRADVWVAGTKTRPDGLPREPQQFKIIWGGNTGIVTTIEGTTRRFDFVIVGTYDASIAIADHFLVGNEDYEIQYIFPSNGYEVKGGGVAYGSKPNG